MINIEQYLETHEVLVYANKGVSMLPMLRQGRDLMIVRRKQPGERLQKYDVAIYIRPPHRYVLHRIIRVEENSYVFLGDNCEKSEPGIREEQVIAVMTGFVHKGRQIDVNDVAYKLYYHIWYYLFPLRKLWKKTVRCGRGIKKRWISKVGRK